MASDPVTTKPVLEIRDLALAIGGARVVDGVSCAVAPGEVLLDGENLVAQPEQRMRALRGRRITMIFQEPLAALDPLSSVGTQVAEATGLSGAAARGAVLAMLAEVGISDPARRIRQYPFELSGGMAQRVMIATALISRPAVLIADEPTTALDVTIQAQILDLLRGLVADTGMALILITHDLGVVAGMCERVNVMYGGMFMESGSAEQLFARPRHPYTLGLLQSVPRLDASQRDRLTPIEGAPRDMLTRPRSCPFQPRCRYAVDRSARELPQLREVEPGHFVACFNPVPAEEWAASRKVAAR